MLERFKFKNIDWERGNGEMISFLIIFPFLIITLFMAINVVSTGVINERVAYNTYSCCRAAALCDSRESALARAQSVLDYNKGKLDMSVDIDYINRWEKGSYCICTITVKDTTSFLPFVRPMETNTLTMMIEGEA